VDFDGKKDSRFSIDNAMSETPNGYPPHNLRLKLGAIVILLKNWSVKDGLCNGTRMIVTALYNHSIKCKILSGRHINKEFLFHRMIFMPRQENTAKGYRLIRTQFPFRLAFSMTINKSQGQSFDRVGILLATPCFSHGQLYTAQSRGKSFDSVRIMITDINEGSKKQGRFENLEGVYTQNIVNKSILFL
jgi:hypothetical protein